MPFKLLFRMAGVLHGFNYFLLSELLVNYFLCLNAYISRILKQIQVLY